MKLDLVNNLEKKNNFVQNFIKELSNYLENNGKVQVKLENDFREENGLYQVVDFSSEGVFLKNTKNNKIFEEKNLPKDLKDKIENDFILRYKDGKYMFEEKMTDDFLNSLVGIKEYREIKERFEKETNILKIAQDTKFNIISRQKEYSVLGYEGKNQIIVPNSLLPYFIDNETTLNYKNGKFVKN